MANPNIINVGTLSGNTEVLSITTSPTAIVSNGSGSGKLLKVSSLFISNANTTTSATITVELYRNSTSYYIMYRTPLPVGTTLDVISKYLYLKEGDSLRVTALTSNEAFAVASFEEIS
jgi:hypothetical protein